MRNLFLLSAIIICALCQPANAGCFGSGSFKTCNDDSGNNYTIQKFGNTTHMQGNNYQTGSTWSQNTNTFGNITTHTGNSNGNAWRATEQRIGNTTFYNGQDSNGNAFHKTCGITGCY
jgi:hypothetical protein